ncbi:MAG: DUF3810 domain-containing protein [Lachnospiraceae bacterium]|nr:DUF3810 domain-containing protein [Lachnospiraceae bacterium]
MKKKTEKKHHSAHRKTVRLLLALIFVLLLPALSPALCDKYTDSFYGPMCDVISHLTGQLPFALGEILMYIGAALLVIAVLMLLLFVFLHRKAAFRSFVKKYFSFFTVILLLVILVYLPTWFIPFRGTVLGRGNAELRTDYSCEEISALLKLFADGANAAAEEIYIADNGSVEFYPSDKISRLAAEAMSSISDEFPRLQGYYPPVKEAICSDILERMWIGGYNYPYTMEPTHNRYISPLYQASLDAHEYAHHKGYYKENEANFLSELALSKSSDPYLRLEGYCEMYDYMLGPCVESLKAAGKYLPDVIPRLSDRVYHIREASDYIEQELYEADEHALDDMPAVNELIQETADTGWNIQGNILKENSYDGVVLLLLQYYCR